MVMAAARTLARRRMGACETTPPATHREHARDPQYPITAHAPPSPSIIFRRLPASSSFVLAAARLRALQLDPGRAAADPGQLRGRSRRTVSPARRQHVVTGPGSYALLTMVALMGAADRVERRGYGSTLAMPLGQSTAVNCAIRGRR